MYLTKTSGNLNPRGQQPQSNLQVSTIRSFEGGLNAADTDLNMSPKFATVLDNVERAIDGSLAVRPGTVLVSNQLTSSAEILNCYYFNTFVITVQRDGAIHKVAGDGSATLMQVQYTGPGGVAIPAFSPWGPGITVVNFTIYNSDLIIVNGRDKPLIIYGHPVDPNFMQLMFLVDPASGSNVNTPIGKYVISHNKYLCIAGSSAEPSILYISGTGTPGTFFPDSGTDGVKFEAGQHVSLGSSTITGLVAYRDKLIVTFERGVLPLNLGVFVGDSPPIHTPSTDGFIEEFGCLNHRSLVSVGDDVFYCDNVGVNSISRTNVFNTLRPVRVSHLIHPLITDALQKLTIQQLQEEVFATYDIQHARYMLFIPSYDGDEREVLTFSYTNIPGMKISAWARLRGWDWFSACRTSLQNIVFSHGNKLYAYDFDNDSVNADYLGDPDLFSGDGKPIDFVWELPWADMKHRMDIKVCRYLGLDTRGTAKFTVETYVDNLVMYQGVRSPLLFADFVGGDSGGYGASLFGEAPYGGGRISSDERLYAWPAKFKLVKLRFIGSTRRKLRFISISLAFVHGGIRR